jgi:peptidoglycan biosynthesis protein MviN/MurJ (putative lipid II flippase)
MLGLLTKRHERLSSALPVVFGLNLLNFILALLISSGLAAVLGASSAKDMFDAVLSIPRQLVVSLGLSTLGGSTLYVLSRQPDKTLAERTGLLGTVATIQFAGGLTAWLGLFLFSKHLVSFTLGRRDDLDYSEMQTGLMMSGAILVIQPLTELFGYANSANGRFGHSQIGAIVSKVAVLVSIPLVNLVGMRILIIATVLGAVVGLLFSLRQLQRDDIHPRPTLKLRTRSFRDVLRLSVPWIVAAPLINLAGISMLPILVRSGPGIMSAYGYMNAIYSMALAVLITPILDVITPRLARSASALDHTGAASNTQRLGFMMALAAGTGTGMLLSAGSPYIVSLFLGYGNMKRDSLANVGLLLTLAGVAIVGNILSSYLARLFQARLNAGGLIGSQMAGPAMSLLYLLTRGGTLTIAEVGISLIINATASAMAGVIIARLTRVQQVQLLKLGEFCLAIIGIGSAACYGAVTEPVLGKPEAALGLLVIAVLASSWTLLILCTDIAGRTLITRALQLNERH